MLQAIARLALRAPRRVIGIALLVMVGAAIFGIPVTKSMSTGGFHDPTSESSHASELLAEKFGAGDVQLILSLTAESGVPDSDLRAAGEEVVALLKRLPYVAEVKSAWTSPPSSARALVSEDGKTGLIVAGLVGSESETQRHATEILDQLPHSDHIDVRAGGDVAIYVQTVDQTKNDLMLMEAIALPLSFVVLMWVFGGLFAAALPLAVGVFAIVGSIATIRAITFVTEVSVFALNLIVAMGLALAIDYTLLIVSRYRDELADGAARDEALVRTMTTAGRTVIFSATTVALSMVSMVLFPMYFLKSFAYGGIAVVALTTVAAVVVTPAAIVLLGDRLDALDVRRMIRGVRGRQPGLPRPVSETFWYTCTKAVMRRAVPIGAVIIALLLLVGAPFLGVKWGYPDDRVLPVSAEARQVGDDLRSDFEVNALTDVTVVIPDMSKVTPADLDMYAANLSRVPDVSAVSAPAGTYANGVLVGPPSAPTGSRDGSAFLTVNSSAPLYSPESDTQLDRLHAVPTPAGVDVGMTGWAQISRDSAEAVTSLLPLVLSIMALITLVLLFLLTGSVILPLKALLLNVLSLTAAFGALVWIFQEGHLGGFGTTATGSLLASVPVLLFCLAFGLSMDYEVFLISRIREYWLASGKTRADNTESVAMGLARTGRVVTAAALLMSVTFASLIAAQVSVICMMGVGVTLAVLVDATLVRMLLMPALMRVMGRLNWWAPAPLVRLHRRIGISESGCVDSGGRVEPGRESLASPCRIAEGHRPIRRETAQGRPNEGIDIDLSAALAQQIRTADPDVLRQLIATFVQTLVRSEAPALRLSSDGERNTPNQRNGFRRRPFDTWEGTLNLAPPEAAARVQIPGLGGVGIS